MSCNSCIKFLGKKRIQVACDIILYAIPAIWIAISYSGVINPNNTYIQCKDSYISHEVHENSISISLLLIISLMIPLILMLICEWLHFRDIPATSFCHKGVKRAWSFFISLCVGGLFAYFLVEILKTFVSNPRPNFMNSCKPNLTEEICQQTWIHITWKNCTNPLGLSHAKLIDTMKSFPSGHAAIGVFAATFMTFYIQKRVRVSWSKLLVSFLQLCCWTWAFLCCASRVWDKKHHWVDVLVGGVIGALVAFFTVMNLCSWFEERQISTKEKNGAESLELPSHTPQPVARNGHYRSAPSEEMQELGTG